MRNFLLMIDHNNIFQLSLEAIIRLRTKKKCFGVTSIRGDHYRVTKSLVLINPPLEP